MDIGDLIFYSVDGLQRLVPAALQLAVHQAIGRIDGVVLPTSKPQSRLAEEIVRAARVSRMSGRRSP